MLAADYPFLDLMWTMLIFFLWIMWFWLLFTIVADIFRRHDISGWVKTAWLVFAILLPFLGVFVYLITQNVGMTERNLARVARAARAVRRLCPRDGRRRRGRGDREGEAAPRQRRDHAGRVRRAQAEGAGVAHGRRRWRPRHQSLTGLEPRSFWEHFEALTRIARPSRHEEPVDRARPLVGGRARIRARAGRRAEPRDPRAGDARAARLRPRSSSRDTSTWSASVTRRARTTRRRGGSRFMRDGDWLTADGTTLGADDGVAIAAMMALAEDESLAARPARAADDRRRGGRARGRERPRRVAAHRVDPDQPRQRGGRTPDRRLRGQHRHVDPRRGARGQQPRDGAVDARRHRQRRAGRPLGHGHRARHGRTRSRCSGARCARRTRPVPFRLVSLDGGKSRNAIPRDASAVVSVAAEPTSERSGAAIEHGGRRRSATRSRRPTPASRSTVAAGRRTPPTRGRTRATARCSTRSPSSRPARSR